MAIDATMPILVVDDYRTMIRILRNLLAQIGFSNVDDAASGADALTKMRAKQYGLVISDWRMGPMTGFDLLRQVRADEEAKSAPFIMLTAESATETIAAAAREGVHNCIAKPFSAATLKAKIAAILGEF